MAKHPLSYYRRRVSMAVEQVIPQRLSYLSPRILTAVEEALTDEDGPWDCVAILVEAALIAGVGTSGGYAEFIRDLIQELNAHLPASYRFPLGPLGEL